MSSSSTAIKRGKPSAPAKWLVENGLVQGRVLDYGCGRGDDCEAYGWDGYDPEFCPLLPSQQYDTILCTYVLNVLPLGAQGSVVAHVYGYLQKGGRAYFTVRRDDPEKWGPDQRHVELDLPVVHEEAGSFIIYEMRRTVE